MAAHRYWRVDRLAAYNSVAVSVGSMHLYSNTTRVDAAATLTANVAPTSGALANLQDTDLNTFASWPFPVGLKLQWDFGAGVTSDVTNVLLSSTTSNDEFPLVMCLSWSDDGMTWTLYSSYTAITWPGPKAYTNTTARVPSTNLVSLMMHMDGADLSTSISDEIGHTMVVSGLAKLSTTSPKIGSASLLLNGSGSYLSTTVKPVDFCFGTGDFTVEAWIKTSAAREQVFLDFFTSSGALHSWQLELDSTGKLRWYVGGPGGGTAAAAGTTALNNGVWHHVEVSRVSGTLTLYVDGVSQASVADVRDYGELSATTPLFAVGGQVRQRNATYDFDGYIDEVRIVKGAAAHAANFTPSTTAYPQIAFPMTAVNPFYLPKDNSAKPVFIASLGAVPTMRMKEEKCYVTFHQFAFAFGPGKGRITGTTKLDGTPTDTPVRRKVRLYREIDGAFLREVWSHPTTGAFSFDYIEMGRAHTVVTYDYTNNFRAVVADNITPDLMP